MSNGISPGLDGITNEVLKAVDIIHRIELLEWLNKILDSGAVPEEWCKVLIQPISASSSNKYYNQEKLKELALKNLNGKLTLECFKCNVPLMLIVSFSLSLEKNAISKFGILISRDVSASKRTVALIKF